MGFTLNRVGLGTLHISPLSWVWDILTRQLLVPEAGGEMDGEQSSC